MNVRTKKQPSAARNPLPAKFGRRRADGRLFGHVRLVAAKRPATKSATPDVAEVAGVRDRLGLTQEELARVIGYSTRSVAAWQSGRQPVSAPARLKLTEADRLAAALAQIMPSRKVGQWLRTPNPAFEGQRPMHVLERGEADRLWRMIHQIDANVAN